MSAESIAKSIGHHAHWGFSAGFDFIEALIAANPSSNTSAAVPINILLVQPGDIRHLLFTISRRRRHIENFGGKLPRINFYLLEAPVETLARDLLLLQVLTDFQVPIRQRANVYLEVFGNNKVQRRTSEYIQTLGRQLKVLSAKGTGQLDNVIDFTMLNYREKDMFEAALQAYETTFPFDMDSLYDHRQRGFYEDRFDSRKALADWDYHAGIIKKASIVHIKQYRQWKLTGIAFEFGDQTYSEPNRTMMTYTEGFMKKGKEKGLKKEVMGFWGDIMCSPYFAIGIDSDTPNKHAELLYEIINKNTGTEQHRHHAVEIALYNLYSILSEIELGGVYRMTKANDIYSGLGQQDKLLEPKGPDAEGAGKATGETTEEAGEGKKDLVTALAEECEEAEREQQEKEERERKETEEAENVAAAEAAESEGAAAAAAAVKGAVPPPPPPTAAEEGAVVRAADAVSADKARMPAAEAAPSNNIAQQLAALEKRKKREAALVRAIQRAETIAESYEGIKIYPMTGTLTHLVTKSKLAGTIDGIYVSSRTAQVLSEPGFRELCRDSRCVVAVETGKFLVGMKAETQLALTAKEEELAVQNGFRRIAAPVPRRRRDELDKEDDVIFFMPNV